MIIVSNCKIINFWKEN